MTPLSLWKFEPITAPTMAGIAAEVAADHGLTVAQLKQRTQAWNISHPRQAAMRAMYDTGRFSNAQIARFFGLDHSSVVDGRQAAERRAKNSSRAERLPHPGSADVMEDSAA